MNPAGWVSGRPDRQDAGNRAGPTTGPVPGTSADPRIPPPGGRNRSGAAPPVTATAPDIPDVVCSICDQPIATAAEGCCWLGPDRISSAAHRVCLLRIGETDLGLTS